MSVKCLKQLHVRHETVKPNTQNSRIYECINRTVKLLIGAKLPDEMIMTRQGNAHARETGKPAVVAGVRMDLVRFLWFCGFCRFLVVVASSSPLRAGGRHHLHVTPPLTLAYYHSHPNPLLHYIAISPYYPNTFLLPSYCLSLQNNL